MPNVKNPVIIFPFYSQNEIDQYCWMLEHWNTLTTTNREYEFLLLSRFDFDGDLKNLQSLCQKYASTKYFKLGGSHTGYPQAPTEMWMLGMLELNKLNALYGFYMEYDVMPNSPKWFDWLANQWDDKFMVMGHFVSNDWLDANGFSKRKGWGPHINGAACYNPQIIGLAHTIDIKVAWDIKLYNPAIQKRLELFDFLFGNQAGNWINSGRMMTHGLKDLSAKKRNLHDNFS